MSAAAVSLALVGRLDVAENREVYLCEVGAGGYVRLSKSAYDLYRTVQAGASFEQLATVANRSSGGAVEAADVERAYHSVLEKIEEAEVKSRAAPSGFWLRFRVLPAAFVGRLSRRFTFAYRPAWVAVLLAVIAVGAWLAIREGAMATRVEPNTFWPAYLLFMGSLLAHELGHATGCARFDAPPGDIGVTMYLMYPAFYSNVSAAWRLSRWRRVVVDLGGTYFQLLVGAGYAVAYVVTGWEPLSVALLFILAGCVMSLNPILKFDGYWVVADALGVSNLGQVRSTIFGKLWAVLRRRAAPPLPWPRPILIILGIYSVVGVAFWGYFLWFMAGSAGSMALRVPELLAEIWQRVASWQLPAWAQVMELLMTAFILVFAAMIVRQVAGLAMALLRLIPLPGRRPTEALGAPDEPGAS